MWMTRQEIASELGIVVNSVRGKVQKGQIERKVVDGKNYYRIVDFEKTLPRSGDSAGRDPSDQDNEEPDESFQQATQETPKEATQATAVRKSAVFDPKSVLLEELASLKIERSIDAIEKGDEIDLATNEISRELEARISMRQQRQMKEIEDALERLKSGEYGLCEECGETIPDQRLRLFPAARYCVRCQEEADQHEKLRWDRFLRGGGWREEPSENSFGNTFED